MTYPETTRGAASPGDRDAHALQAGRPPGVLPAADQPGAPCLASHLLSLDPGRREQLSQPGFTGGVADRVDPSTSGAIAVADTPEELSWLRAWLAEGRFVRTYLLRVSAPPTWEEAKCDLPIAFGREERTRVVLRTRPGVPRRGEWAPARTRLRRLTDDVIEATATTLAQHQVRARAAWLGAPLLGDVLYGGAPLADLRRRGSRLSCTTRAWSGRGACAPRRCQRRPGRRRRGPAGTRAGKGSCG